MNYQKILTEAHQAATDAIAAHIAAGNKEHPFNCGFAWVTIDGTGGLARWCRKEIKRTNDAARAITGGNSAHSINKAHRRHIRKLGDKGYPSGWQFWCPGEWPEGHYRQDMDFHAVGSRAFQKKLGEHGIVATVGTRLD